VSSTKEINGIHPERETGVMGRRQRGDHQRVEEIKKSVRAELRERLTMRSSEKKAFPYDN